MKKHVLLFAGLILLRLGTMCQNTANLVIFSEDSEPFYAYINGVKQNDKPETNVKFAGVTSNISLRLEFENKALPHLKQTMSLEPGFEHTARIRRDKNQQLKLRYFGQVPLNESSSGEMTTVNYHTAENVAAGAPGADTHVNNADPTISGSSITTQVNSGRTTSEAVAVNIIMPGADVTMNVDNPATGPQTTTSTTVTQSASSPVTYGDPTQPPARVVSDATPVGCSTAMSPSGFNRMKESVESKSFSDTKMSTAKIATKSACLSVNQVKEICKLFSMDDDKLVYAKYAYEYCVDKANYYQVSDVFSFSGTTDEFNKFLEK